MTHKKDELELLAQAAVQRSEQPDKPDHNDIKRWQSLFGFTYSQATLNIVRAEKEAQGFNKEAYEYSCTFKLLKPSTTKAIVRNQSYLLRLGGPIDSVEVVKLASQMKQEPPIYYSTDDDDMPATFYKIDMSSRNNILAYLLENESRFQPTFIPYSIAAKELSTTSSYPTLEVDYPIWYFFYRTLADPAVLGRLLGVEPLLPNGIVHGSAFLVQDQNQEEILRCYGTDKHEVVRCELNTRDNKIKGTFRFVGNL
ncbi:hypothetical protein F5Y09DRAFT_333923 [Xylaria sp. FL1042]|nr:hypothetical protein F5Y09DRAFT_333923 [Xylaria sp. FL1042]